MGARTASAVTAPDARATASSALRALERLLDDLAGLLIDISPQIYTARPMPGVSGSIGGHVRHTLDHVAALVGSAAAGGPLSYDRRERGTSVEHEPSAALRAILRLKASLSMQPVAWLQQPIEVDAVVDPSGGSITTWSTVGRELAFVMSHTTHHQALIAMLLATMGVAAPAWFGYAPATPRRSDA